MWRLALLNFLFICKGSAKLLPKFAAVQLKTAAFKLFKLPSFKLSSLKLPGLKSAAFKIFGIKTVVAVLFISSIGTVNAFEYLSDEELSKIDGHTSPYMVRQLAADGKDQFARKDEIECRYYLSDHKETKVRCEMDSNLEREVSLQDYLKRVFMQLENMEILNPLDLTVDNRQTIEMELLMRNFDYSKDLTCRHGNYAATVYLENININRGTGKPMIIGPTTSTVRVMPVNGKHHSKIVMESEGLKGTISIGAIKLGNSVEDAENAPSFGSLRVQFPEGMKTKIEIYR